MVTADRAAEIILRGLDRRQQVIAFPWQLVALTRAGRLVPPGIERAALKYFGAAIEKDSR
jgi:hypothetical protein